MDELLESLDLDVRIASIKAIRSQVEGKLMRESGVMYLDDERLSHSLTDALIDLRAEQIDRIWLINRAA